MLRSKRTVFTAALACGALLLTGAALARATDLSSPDRALEGIWRLDKSASDDPARMMAGRGPGGGGPGGRGGRGPHGMGGGERPGGGMGGESRGGPPGGGPGGGGGPGEEQGERPGDAEGGGGDTSTRPREGPMWRLMHPAAQVVIFVLNEQVEVTEDERAPVEFALKDSLDAHHRESEKPLGVARWMDARLVTNSAVGRRGGFLIETYEVSRDGHTLTVSARTEGGPEGAPALTLKRVYRRYDGE